VRADDHDFRCAGPQAHDQVFVIRAIGLEVLRLNLQSQRHEFTLDVGGCAIELGKLLVIAVGVIGGQGEHMRLQRVARCAWL
jgi:hypothetical protein